MALFGGNRSFAAAQADVGVALRYKTRFRPVPFNARLLATAPAAKDSFIPDSGLVAVPGGVAAVVQPGGSGAAAGAAAVPTMVAVVADREFNTGAIAKAALGDGAVRGFTSGRDASRSGGGGFAAGGGGAGDNEAEAAAIAFVLAPAGADGAMFRAELTTTQRRVEVRGASTKARLEQFFFRHIVLVLTKIYILALWRWVLSYNALPARVVGDSFFCGLDAPGGRAGGRDRVGGARNGAACARHDRDLILRHAAKMQLPRDSGVDCG